MATAEIIVSRTASSVFNRAFRLCFGCLIFRIAIRGFAGGRNNVRHSWSERSKELSHSLSLVEIDPWISYIIRGTVEDLYVEDVRTRKVAT